MQVFTPIVLGATGGKIEMLELASFEKRGQKGFQFMIGSARGEIYHYDILGS